MTKKEVLDAAARGEGCLGRSADDEPVFVIVARDLTSTRAVFAWCRLAADIGAPQAKLDGAVQDARDMDLWRERHGGKVPD
jgi:hypothetical protein